MHEYPSPMQVFSFFVDEQTPKLIEIEYHSRFQIPSFQILGLPAPEIQEARERITAAFLSSEFEFPKKKITINLAPSSIRKSGTGHDLAIATKILEATLEIEWPERVLAWGELGLDGVVKPIGRMAGLIELLLKSEQNLRGNWTIVLSEEDSQVLFQLLDWRKKQGRPCPEKSEFRAISHLKQISEREIPKPPPSPEASISNPPVNARLLPLSPQLERILQICLIGRHHLLLLGPKGIGKSESIHWFESLLPCPSPEQLWDQALSLESRLLAPTFQAPIRRVHAQVKPSHLLGTFHQKGYQAGELALAHGGLLIADEFLEWPRDSKECLREPLQTERVTLTRVKGKFESKCELQLIATGNLCPCGGLPQVFRSFSQGKAIPCRCRPNAVFDYFNKLSGPILDRIDLIALLGSTPKIQKPKKNTQMEQIKESIEAGRAFALKHFQNLPSRLSPIWLEESLPEKPEIEALLAPISSLRARHKILRVARSIQALEKSPELKVEHVFESKAYRFMDNWLESVPSRD